MNEQPSQNGGHPFALSVTCGGAVLGTNALGDVSSFLQQADLALQGKDRKTGNVVEEVSRPGSRH